MTLSESQAARSALETFKTHRIRLHIQGLKACDTAEFGVGMNLKSTQVRTPTQTAPAMGRSRVFRWSASGDRALDPFTGVVRQQAPGSEMWTRICPQPWNGQSRRGPESSTQASRRPPQESITAACTPGPQASIRTGPAPGPTPAQSRPACPCLRRPSALESSSPAPRSRVALPRGWKSRQAPRTGCSPPHSPAAHAASSGAARAGRTRLRR